MKILLLGEFSNVHWTLSQALRKLGHQVVLISNKGEWKGYQQDITLNRKSNRPLDTFTYLLKLAWVLPKCRGYDVVQLIGPSSFFDVKINRLYTLFRYLKKQNKKIFLDAFWTDYYYIKACTEERRFRYSDFMIGNQPIEHFFNQRSIQDWMHDPMKSYNIRMAKESNGIPTCLYEYHAAYAPYYPEKEQYISLPIDLEKISPRTPIKEGKIHFFIGIQASRNELKGTDIMYKALQRLQKNYPERCSIEKVEDVPYATYEKLMNQADVLLDQLYSYTPAMNALLAMAKGIVVVGGGEEEHYQLLGEDKLRPIVNVQPTEEDVYQKLEDLVLHPEQLKVLSQQSIAYVKKHHEAKMIAQRYLDFWKEKA